MTRAGKKAAREQAKRAAKRQRRLTRDQRQKMQQGALAARNVHREPGRTIAVRDVTPYARAGCTKCRGKGIVGYRKVGETRGAEPCACATKRFWKAHPEIIVTDKGVAFWPIGEAPEEITAAKEARFTTKDIRAVVQVLRDNNLPVDADGMVSIPLASPVVCATTGAPFHEDPDNSGMCIKCGVVLDEDGPVAAEAARELTMVHGICAPPAGTTVHHLHAGQTACTFGRAYVFPRDWPAGHLWSSEPKDVNCQGCLDILEVRKAILA